MIECTLPQSCRPVATGRLSRTEPRCVNGSSPAHTWRTPAGRHTVLPAGRSGRFVLVLGALGVMGASILASNVAGPVDTWSGESSAFLATSDRDRSEAASRAGQRATAPPAAASKAKAPAKKAAAPKKPVLPRPVGGLSQVQMNNAAAIVKAGRALKMPRRGVIIAVATAMQESTLLNRASEVLPESKRYPHQGTGSDHDSVGLFQQRPSSGWGTVRNLMKPHYAATKFYVVLRMIPGWRRLPLYAAAQAVQVSAYPYAYAKHERLATIVVDAL